MKCFILLSLVALCYSYPYTTGYGSVSGYGHGITVNADGSITLTTPTGKMINISKGIGSIKVASILPIGKQYEYGSQWFTTPQDDVMAQILGNYQGDVSQDVYQKLMQQVSDAVQAGQVPNDIYQALQTWGQVETNQWGNQLGNLPYQQFQNVEQQWPVYGMGIQQGLNPYGTVGSLGGQIVGYTGSQGVFGTGKSTWSPLMNILLSGNQQYGQVVPSGQSLTGKLYQIAQKEQQILDQQSQIQQEQLKQQQQQQQLLHQQEQQLMKQQQQQIQQEYLTKQQQQELEQQEQVLGQQQVMSKILTGVGANMPTSGQLNSWWQQQPFYSQGKYFGGYGQSMRDYTTPIMVY